MTPSSTMEFLIGLMLAASVVAIITERLRIPYPLALVLVGLALGSVHLPLIGAVTGRSFGVVPA
jgi:Kef-type K+ transport system membrane component KefB